jgi:hypothetical protein
MCEECGCEKTEKPDMSEEIARFEEIMAEIKNLAEEAFCLLPPNDQGMFRAHAEAYWYPQIIGTVDGDVSVVMHSMEDTAKELKEYGEPDDEDPDDDY